MYLFKFFKIDEYDSPMLSALVIFLFIFFVDSTKTEQITEDNVTTPEPIVYMVRSRYEEWLDLVNEIATMRENQRVQRKQMKRRNSAELRLGDKVRHDLYLKIYYQKVGYDEDLRKHRHLKNSLFYFKYLTILQNHIDDYERLALHFEPDMDQIKRNFRTTMARAEEIRRQRWNYILNHCGGFQIFHDLIDEIDKAGIQHSNFSKEIARGYKLLARNLRPDKLHEITPMRFLPDLRVNITGDFEADKCFIVLMADYAKKNNAKV